MAKPVTIAPVNYALIRHVLKSRDMMIGELSEKLGISISYLSDMLSGRSPLNDERLVSISDILEVPHNYFRTSIGRLAIQKTESDIVDWSLSPERGDVKELQDYLDVSERMGYIDFSPELPDEVGIQSFDFWKKDAILPFESDNCVDFWGFDGDEILIRGPARCGKSTLILEWLISLMFRNRGMQVLIARAFGVDLDAVRQNLVDLVKYRFSDPLSSIRVAGGAKFHTVHINEGRIELRGIDRPGSQLGAGYDVVLFSQAEQIKKENIDVIASRCTPASKNWIEDGRPRSMVVYDANANRLDHWIELAIKNGLAKIDFDFQDHPAYFDDDGNATELYESVYGRLSRLEGVWRERLLEGKAANPEGTIFNLEPVHLLKALPANFEKTHLFYRGFDFGMRDPSVCLWFGVHRSTGDVIVFREWRRVGVDTIEMGESVKGFSNEHIVATVIDNDENLQSILQKNCGIVTELAQKGPNSIASGITLIQHRLKKAVDGEDGGLYFYNNPVVRDPVLVKDNQPLTVVDESELYAWSENSDTPIDAHNHGFDIIRYVLDYLENRKATVGFGGGVTRRQKRQ